MTDTALVLVDSSSWIEALRPRGNQVVRERVRSLLDEGTAAWCDIVALELWHGARGSREREVLGELTRTLKCFSIDAKVWQRALKLSIKARDNGLTAPTADLVISACADTYGVVLEHCDKYLSALQSLRLAK